MGRPSIRRWSAAAFGGAAAVAVVLVVAVGLLGLYAGDSNGIELLGWAVPLAAAAAAGAFAWLVLDGGTNRHEDRSSQGRSCPACGRPMLEDWRLCPHCGTLIDQARIRGGRVSANH